MLTTSQTQRTPPWHWVILLALLLGLAILTSCSSTKTHQKGNLKRFNKPKYDWGCVDWSIDHKPRKNR